MLSKPSTCLGCVLHDVGKGFVPDETVENPDYTVLAEAPGSSEVHEGRPLVGKAGFVLKSWIMRSVPAIQVAYERKKVSLCNVLKCQPPELNGRPYPVGETRIRAEAHCRQYLNLGNPKTIILVGEVPQRALFGPELEREDATDRSLGRSLKGVLGRVGRVYERDGTRYVFGPHPAFILRQPSLIGHAVEAFKIAVSATYIEPQALPWQEAVQELMMPRMEVIV